MADPDETQPGRPPGMKPDAPPAAPKPAVAPIKRPPPQPGSAPPSARAAPTPVARAAPAPRPAPVPRAPRPAPVDSVGMHRFKILWRRALHSDLEPIEVLPDERPAFDTHNVHGGSEPLKRLLLWRRAALLVAFLFQLPPLLVRFIKSIIAVANDSKDAFAGIELFLVMLEIAVLFAILAAMRRWASWHRSRRLLLWTWVISYVGTFAVALIPLRTLALEQGNDALELLVGMGMGIAVFIQLAPKVLALIPGILRACIIAKAAFPMSALPGWVIMVSAPFDALLMYVVIMLPYQMTGGGWMIPAIILLTVAPLFFYRGGRHLAAPHSLEQALGLIAKTRRFAIIANVAGGLFLIVGLLVTVGAMEIEGHKLFTVADVFLPIFSLVAGIFLLEVIGIDVMLTAMVKLERSRAEQPDMSAAQEAYKAEITLLSEAIEVDRTASA